MLESNEIGRKLLTSSLDPFLKIGMVFDILRKSGNVPVENDKLKRSASGLDISSFKRYIISFGMRLGPYAFPTSIDAIINLISTSSQGYRAMEFVSSSGR